MVFHRVVYNNCPFHFNMIDFYPPSQLRDLSEIRHASWSWRALVVASLYRF